MKRWLWGLGALALLGWFVSSKTCLSTGFRYGLWLDQCPDGEFRQTLVVGAPSVVRGAESAVTVRVLAHYTTGDADRRNVTPIGKFTADLSLTGAADGPKPLVPKKGWHREGDAYVATVEWPKVNDGDYQLRTHVSSALGETTLDVPVALYAPARVHVLTDRPLYEPGNTVKFRAVALKANDLAPLDGRPGTWQVVDPAGDVLLEERAPAGAWGVVSGSFPLDRGAQSGTWRVTWVSGATSETRAFTVKPFTLPRFSISAAPAKPFYRRNERPVLKGTVKYASGAPVANAKVTLDWSVSGEWPPPTSWADGSALPKDATTSASGSFSVDLPTVPDDLKKQAQLNAALAAVDASGDRVEGAATILLSEDLIQATAVTELADGLVEGFNNRMYLRATTADGRVLEGVTLNVKRLWEPTDKGTDAVVDSDGVASVQVDPGPPVNVVVPAMPFRPPPKADPVERTELTDVLASKEVSLADRLTFDRAENRLVPCTQYVEPQNGGTVVLGLLVGGPGSVLGVTAPTTRLGRCVRDQLSSLRFEPGHERLLHVTYSFNDEDLPRLQPSVRGVPQVPAAVQQTFDQAMADVRDCLPSTIASGTWLRRAWWKFEPNRREPALLWGDNPAGQRGLANDSVLRCVESRLAQVKWPKAAKGPNDGDAETDNENEEGSGPGAVGVVEFSVSAPEKYEAERPEDTVMTGYEFLITAKKGRELLGTTKLLMTPGSVPNVRLRASSQIVNASETVTVELLRGPDFTGELPEKLYLNHHGSYTEAKVDAEKRQATFTMPSDAEGWAEVDWNEAKLVFFIRPKSELAVKVTPEKPRYAPGQIAQLGIETSVSGAGHSAAIGLFGVDESLGQLATLPGADELSGLRPQVTSSAPFAGLDAQALSMGRVRGANAAAATLLRVSSLPPPPAVEAAVSVQGQTVFDPNEPLVDRFYAVLAELHLQTREWEQKAPAAEKMTPRTMANLWAKAVAAVEARKESAKDAWGRPLRLHRLPADLLALTDPRQVVVEGTRLPEDTQNWSAWVAKEKP